MLKNLNLFLSKKATNKKTNIITKPTTIIVDINKNKNSRISTETIEIISLLSIDSLLLSLRNITAPSAIIK